MAETGALTAEPSRRSDGLSLLVGVLCLIGAGLYLLDHADVVRVDEAVAAAALWVGVAAVALIRAVLGLLGRHRSRR